MTDTFGLDNIDDLVMQSKKIMDDSGDDSGNSTAVSTDYGSSSPESAHGRYQPEMNPINIKQETNESLMLGSLSSPQTQGQMSDSYYSNESSNNSTPDTERSGSKKTAYNEKWGVKVLKGKTLN